MKWLLLTLFIPWSATFFLGLWHLFLAGPGENASVRVMKGAVVGTFLSLLGLSYYVPHGTIHLPPFFQLDDYAFHIDFLLDKTALVFAFLSTLLMGVITQFSAPYLHFEKGHARFYLLLSLAQSAIMLVLFAGSIDLLFFGWELIGISSVLLVSFFRHHWKAGIHSEYVIIHYRLADVGLLTAACWMHFFFKSSEFSVLNGLPPSIGMQVVLFFIVWASLAKSGQVPLNTWMTKAMEGPTSSSAIFYGGLSIHLGVFLLLRFLPLIEQFIAIRISIFSVGLLTAIYSAARKRTRNDAKSFLAYATTAQVGLMYIEIALGFENLVLMHVCSNALLRTFQFLKAPGLLQDFLENPLQRKAMQIRNQNNVLKLLPAQYARKFYTWSYSGMGLEEILKSLCRKVLWPFHKIGSWEQSLLATIDGDEQSLQIAEAKKRTQLSTKRARKALKTHAKRMGQ